MAPKHNAKQSAREAILPGKQAVAGVQSGIVNDCKRYLGNSVGRKR
jgi:hypothetical protein